MPAARRFPVGLLLLACILVSYCTDTTGPGDDSGDTPVPTRYAPGIHVLAAPPGDTIDAVTDQALRVRVVGSDSLPLRLETVRFEGVAESMLGPDWGIPHPTLLPGSTTTNAFGQELARTTDEEGVAEVRVKMGRNAGDGRLRVVVPAYGMVDTVRIEVLPGRPVAIRTIPADTAVIRGRAYSFQAYQRDRSWNPVPGGISYELQAGVEVAGDSIRGLDYGRLRIIARAGEFMDSLMVSVVPAVTLAAYENPLPGVPGGIVVFSSDGSERRTLVGYRGGSGMNHLTWSRSADRIAFTGDGHAPPLFVVTLQGTLTEVPMTAAVRGGHFVPEYSLDDAWIFFAGTPDHQNAALYRVPAVGGEVEQVGPHVEEWHVDSRPALSPDGQRLVFTTNRATPDNGYTIRVLHLPTGSIDSLDVTGDAPRWSPDGERIAFTRDDGIHLMRPDGTYLGRLASGSEIAWIDWSPDGLWIAASTMVISTFETYGIELIRVEDGLRIILPYSLPLRLPRFRPE